MQAGAAASCESWVASDSCWFAVPCMDRCDCLQNLSDLAWALSEMGVTDEEFFHVIADR